MRANTLPLISLVALLAAGPIQNAAAQTEGCVSTPAATVNYEAQIQPFFDTFCVSCHQNSTPTGGLSLQDGTAPGSLINVLNTTEKMVRVSPGDPSASYLYRKLRGTHIEAGGTGIRMPPAGPLSDREIALIETWIKECQAPG